LNRTNLTNESKVHLSKIQEIFI